MNPEAADAFARATAAYVHIPFCSAVCPYCDFAVVAGRDELVDRYVDAVIAEIRMSEPWHPLEAIYFGGGTPSHVDPVSLARVLEALAAHHGIAPGAEISLEANPEDFDASRAALLHRVGFNRVSFGAQSFDPRVLESLGRRHTGSQIDSSFGAAREAGFDNVSIDLIFGDPVESTESWEESLYRAIALGPDHLSCYALTVEAGTPLGRAVAGGAASPDPDLQADRYEMAETMIPFPRYEVSNWARPGKECRYNLTVWAQGEYIAHGNGAHGYRAGVRTRNARHLDTYLERIEEGELPTAGSEPIEGWDAEIDRVFVGLRRTVGVSQGPGTLALLGSYDGYQLEKAGAISTQSGRLAVVEPLLTDAVMRAVLDLERPNVPHEDDA